MSPFVCTLCTDKYDTEEDLNSHLVSCHNKTTLCPICSFKNDDIKQMITHINSHLPSSPKKLIKTKKNNLHSNEEKEKRRKYQNQKRIYEETGQLPPNKKRKLMPPIGDEWVYGFDGVIIFKR